VKTSSDSENSNRSDELKKKYLIFLRKMQISDFPEVFFLAIFQKIQNIPFTLPCMLVEAFFGLDYV